MPLNDCIPGYIPRSERQQLEDAAQQWERYGKTREEAEMAAVNALDALAGDRRRTAILSATAEKKIADAVRAGGADALEAKIRTSARGVGANEASAEVEQQIAHTQAATKMAEFRDLAVETKPADAPKVGANVMRELSGIDSGNAKAKAAATSLRNALEWTRSEFNRLGGKIKTRGNYLLPQTWDAAKIREAGRDAFVERMARFYETPGAMDPLLGPHGAPLSGDELRGALGQIHDTIQIGNTTGTIGVVQGAMRNRHLDPRSISFRDVDARIEAADLFGEPNVFETVEGHIRQMSQEIGAMRVFGPNPDLAYAHGRELAQTLGATQTRLVSIDNTYKSVSGALNSVASDNIAMVGGAIRAGLTGGLLPLSLASQLSDVVPVSLTSSLFRIPALETVVNGIKQVVGAGLSHAELSRMGVVVDGMIAHLQNTGVMDAGKRTRWFSEKTMRFYGIKQWAEGMQASMEATMLGHLGRIKGKAFEQADTAMGGNLSKLGWSPETWDAVRQHGINAQGFASVRALDESSLPDALKQKAIGDLIYTSKRFASLGMTIPDAKTRGMMALGTQRGTLVGEGARMATQFKSFGTQFFINQLGQILQLEGGDRIAYATRLLAGTAALGMLSLQIKRLLKGQEPADMTQHRTQLSAIMQGGGFGIIGDFFNTATQQSRFGHGLVTTLAGPAFGAAEDVAALTFGNIGQAARGERANFASEAIRLGGRYVPFANAPFMGVAFQRLAVDQARLWADPSGTRRSFMTTEQKQRQEYNARYWWRPGRTTPEFAR